MKRWNHIPSKILSRTGTTARRYTETIIIAALYIVIFTLSFRLFSVWKGRTFIARPATMDEFCRHKDAASFDSSSIINSGSTDRLHNVLRTAMAGRPVSIGIIGGSVSSCHGIEGSPTMPYGNPLAMVGYPRKVYQWWTDLFPMSDHQLSNGASRRTDVQYYAHCFEQHLPATVDLVIIELDGENDRSQETMDNMEILVRSLLIRPNNPAVLLLGHFSPSMQQRWGYSGSDLYHKTVADYYKVPYISLKPTMYQRYLTQSEKFANRYFIDEYLPNENGHQLLTDLIVGYIANEICDLETVSQKASVPLAALSHDGATSHDGVAAREGSTKSTEFDRIPPLLSATANDLLHPRPPPIPYCASADNLMDPVRPYVDYGWYMKEDTMHREEWKKYWHTKVPGSILQIPIFISRGRVGVYHRISPDPNAGRVKCWVDTNKQYGVIIDGYAEYSKSVLTIIDHTVPDPGAHYVVCEALKQPLREDGTLPEMEFMIYGMFAT